jgi:diguanylate cyclase (GGDEF)-like protein/PAS domain S-box-containing protein
MNVFLLVAFAALLVGVGWAGMIVLRSRRRSHQVVFALLAVVALAHMVLILRSDIDTTIRADDLPVLGAAVAFLLTVLLLHRTVARHERMSAQYGAEQAYLTELFENSPEAIVLLDSESRVVRVNTPFTELFGYAVAEIEGKVIDDVIAGPDRKDEAHALTQRIAQGEKVSVETTRMRKNGSSVEVAITGVPVRYGEGQVAVFGIYRDMTERNRMERSLRRLRKAVETTQLGVTVTDTEGKIVYVNPAEAEMHGWNPEELIGKDARVFAAESHAMPMSSSQLSAVTSWRRESVNVRKDGSVFPVQLMSDVVRDVDGSIMGIVTTCEDIARRKQAEAALRASEERYALAARGANDGLWDWEVQGGAAFYSDRWTGILGYEMIEIEETIDWWLDRIHPEDREQVMLELDMHLTGESEQFQSEHRVRHRDGTYRWVLMRGLAVRDPEGKPHRMAGSLTDVSERKRIEESLARDALYDPLTGLPNRAFFMNLLQRAARRVQRRQEYQFAVLFMDLDRFKVVNDSLGHETGDRLLVGVAQRLEKCLRPGDVVARLAGDEFCVLVDNIMGPSDAVRVAERVQEALQAPFHLNDHRVFAMASIGIATSTTGVEAEHVLRDADTAMYRAKARGRGRFEVFDQEMHDRAMRVLEIESDLRAALQDGQFRLAYLPVVSLDSRRIIGFEALARWEHPERGLVSPAEFVPIAEETGVILPFGRWVLREACSQMARWAEQLPDRTDLTISVNLSARQLQQADLVDDVRTALEESGIEPHRLKLEVTESVLMNDPDFSTDVVQRLNGLGVQVQIDDFGTGYSSLSYLSRLQIQTLKIDRSFITSLGEPGTRSIVVEAIIRLARDLGIRVIAEGVETSSQLEGLRDLACEQGQGFLFSQPVNGDDAAALLTGPEG